MLSSADSTISDSAARRVLNAARAAMGGDAWTGVRSIRSVYTLHSGGRLGTIDRLEDVATGRFVSHLTLPGISEADGFDGITTWTQPKNGVPYPLGDKDARLQAQDDAYRTERGWWFPMRAPAVITYEGVRQDSGATFDVLTVAPEGGRPFTVWFDTKSHLIRRYVEPAAERPATTTFSDYRAVQGILLPFTVTSDEEVEMLDHVELNVRVDDSAFSLPAEPATLPSSVSSHAVTVPIRLSGNRVIVPVTVNGQGPFDAEFDSGGSFVLPPALLARLHLATQGIQRGYGGGEGYVQTSRGVVDRLALGGATLGSQPFSSFPLSTAWPERLLVGEEVLFRYVVRIDFDKMQMTLTPAAEFQYSGTGDAIPFHFQENQPEVTGSVDGIAGTFIFDTGDSGSLLLIAPFARRYALVERYHATVPYSGVAMTATHGLYTRVGRVRFDGEDGRAVVSVAQPVTRISQQQFGFDANKYVSGNIGMGIIRQFNITFDYHRHVIYLERNHFFGQRDIFNETGLRLRPMPESWEVTTVYPGSAAANAGIVVGDQITRIDGRTPSRLDADTLNDLMRAPAGTRLHLDLRRGHAVVPVTLVLADIL